MDNELKRDCLLRAALDACREALNLGTLAEERTISEVKAHLERVLTGAHILDIEGF